MGNDDPHQIQPRQDGRKEHCCARWRRGLLMLSHQLATSFCPLLAVPAVPLPLASPRPLALPQPEQAAPIPSIRALSVKYK
jgi:hypothetical protein